MSVVVLMMDTSTVELDLGRFRGGCALGLISSPAMIVVSVQTDDITQRQMYLNTTKQEARAKPGVAKINAHVIIHAESWRLRGKFPHASGVDERDRYMLGRRF